MWALKLGLSILISCLVPSFHSRTLSIQDFGAIPDSKVHSVTNRGAFNTALANATAGDTVLVPKGTWHFVGGLTATGLNDVTIQIDGVMSATEDLYTWEMNADKTKYLPFIGIYSSSNFRITSSANRGTILGNGRIWWDKCILGKHDPEPIPPGDSRPRLIYIHQSTDFLVEKLSLINSPFWTLTLDDCARVEVRYVDVEVDRNLQRGLIASAPERIQALIRGKSDPGLPVLDALGNVLSGKQSLKDLWLGFEAFVVETIFDAVVDFIPPVFLQPEDLNTDGIDPSGHDFHIHHCTIHNDDDSIAVKPSNKNSLMGDCTENVLVEDMVLSGFGASIGSVPADSAHNCVRNVTFRNIFMPKTGKGIYVKSNPSCDTPGNSAEISNILYENVHIKEPWWWAIWIGPQQQHQPGTSLGEDCALTYPFKGACPTMGCVDFRNITLRNVLIENPMLSPGVIMGNSTNPMQGIVFDNVTVTKPGQIPFKGTYKCEFIDGIAKNSNPVPNCFKSGAEPALVKS